MSYQSTTPGTGDLNASETYTLISSDKVDGTTVYNLQQEKLGKIHNLMIDKISGEVAFAVLSFGGFLGIGDSYYPIPWRMLKYSVSLEGYIVDIDRRVLEGAPNYTSENSVDWLSPAYGRSVDDYYSNSLT